MSPDGLRERTLRTHAAELRTRVGPAMAQIARSGHLRRRADRPASLEDPVAGRPIKGTQAVKNGE
jgi:hypothetical protein